MKNRWGKVEKVTDFTFLWSKITVDGDYSHEVKRHLLLGRKAMTNLDGIIKWRYITLPIKVPIVKAMVFSNSSEWTCESDCKEGWVSKNWCLQTVVLEKTPESPLDSKEIQPVILKEINPEYSLEGLMLIEAPILWPPDAKSRLTGQNPDAGKDWRQEKKGATEDEMVGWHH